MLHPAAAAEIDSELHVEETMSPHTLTLSDMDEEVRKDLPALLEAVKAASAAAAAAGSVDGKGGAAAEAATVESLQQQLLLWL